MSEAEIPWLGVTELGARYRARELSPTEVLEALLDWIAATEPIVHSFVSLTAARAREEAAAATRAFARGEDQGPMQGIPYSVKDLIAVAGVPLRAGSRATASWLPTRDAAVVSRLRAAGAVCLGKVTTHEFAWGMTSEPSRNPWDGEALVGGSSGGSAAAVAAGQGPCSIGTDCGCSVRAPAALNGVSAIRPTHGRVSTAGCVPLSMTMDNVGPFARSAEDLAIVLGVVAGPDPDDPASLRSDPPDFRSGILAGVSGLRLGIPSEHFFDSIEPEVEQLTRRAIGELVELGITAAPVELPHAHLAAAADVAIVTPESAVLLADLDRELLGADVRSQTEAGHLIPATDYVRAQQVRELIATDFERAFTDSDFDVIVCPAVPATAKRTDGELFLDLEFPDGRVEDIGWAYCRYTFPMSLAGTPTAVVPVGLSGGLPTGMQIVTRRYDEATALRVAHAYQAATPHHRRRPTAIAAVGVG
ncbi:MAG: amidase [Solirubrobacteraceae bacterium]